MDQTVDPCEDFYSFANGGWLKSHPIPEEAGLFGIAQYIDSQNNASRFDRLALTRTAASRGYHHSEARRQPVRGR